MKVLIVYETYFNQAPVKTHSDSKCLYHWFQNLYQNIPAFFYFSSTYLISPAFDRPEKPSITEFTLKYRSKALTLVITRFSLIKEISKFYLGQIFKTPSRKVKPFKFSFRMKDIFKEVKSVARKFSNERIYTEVGQASGQVVWYSHVPVAIPAVRDAQFALVNFIRLSLTTE